MHPHTLPNLFQGIYEISETVNEKSSWKKGDRAIWYSQDYSWDIGPIEYLGTTISSMYTYPDYWGNSNSGGLTDDTLEWKYTDGGVWKTAPTGDISIECMKY